MNISDVPVNELLASGKKLDWPGGTAGVTCDPVNGDIFMVLSGQGLEKKTGQSRFLRLCRVTVYRPAVD